MKRKLLAIIVLFVLATFVYPVQEGYSSNENGPWTIAPPSVITPINEKGAIFMKTGETVQQSGIYKCTKCGNEITCVLGNTVPPCSKCNNTAFTLVRASK